MRAERFRGWRIRSPSWRNELIEKDIRQKSPAVPGFFFLHRLVARIAACEIPARQYSYDLQLQRMTEGGLMKAPAGRGDLEGA
jgi:hypothetical protein